MALNIKSLEVEKLAADVAALTHETKTEAIRVALVERRSRLRARGFRASSGRTLRTYLEQNVWPIIPTGLVGQTMTRKEEDQILGYGPEGY